MRAENRQILCLDLSGTTNHHAVLYRFCAYIIALLFCLVFIAVIFFTSKMAMKSELIAILASGTRFNRMMRPYLIGGIFLGLILLLGAKLCYTKSQRNKNNISRRFMLTAIPLTIRWCRGSNRSMYFRIDSFTYAGARNYDTSAKSAAAFCVSHQRQSPYLQPACRSDQVGHGFKQMDPAVCHRT